MNATATIRETRTSATPALSTASAIGLVAEREIVAKVRSKSFVISTVALIVLIVGGIVAMNIFGGSLTSTHVAVVEGEGTVLEQAGDVEVTEVADRAAATRLVESGDVDAAVVPDPSSPAGVTIIALDAAPNSIVLMLSAQPTVELLEPSSDGDGPMRYLLAVGFGVLFISAAFSFGSTMLTSVIEEKATRVVEILLSAMPARILLAGKVLGNTAIAMGQIVLILAAVTASLIIIGETDILRGLGAPLLWFALFFFVGFIVLAAMFAAAGSMVSRLEDSGPVMSPLTWILMAPYLLVIFFNDNEPVMSVMSYVPLASTVAMPIRLYFGEAQWWEPVLSLATAIAAAVAIVMVGARIYERSLLKMGARVKLSDALRG